MVGKKIDRSDQGKKVYYLYDPGALALKWEPSPEGGSVLKGKKDRPSIRGGLISGSDPEGESFLKQERIAAAVDEAIDSGVDVFAAEIFGMVPWYPSKVYPAEEHERWFEDTFEKSGGNVYSDFAKKGNDMLEIMCGETHEKGAEFWLSYRVNDFHGMTAPVTQSTAKSVYISRFYMEHQDQLIGEPQSNCPFARYMLDFQYEDVREYKLALIQELIENYDIDGFSVDFLRVPTLFNLNTTTSEQRLEIMLDFLGSIRRMLDDKTARTGQEYYLGVKIPIDMDSYDKLGIDVTAYEKEAGVNVFFVFDFYNTRQDYETLDHVRKNTEHSLVNFEMSDCTTWTKGGIFRESRGTTKEQFYTTAYMAYLHGADGVSLFNFAFYRYAEEFGSAYDPPFEVVKGLKDMDFLAAQPQHYFEGATENKLIHDFDLAAVSWKPGESHTFDMEMRPPANGWTTDGVLRLESFNSEIAGLDLEVRINGNALRTTELEEKEPYEDPYDSCLGKLKNWLGYLVPKDILTDGVNKVTVVNSSDREVKLQYVDVAIR